ncbi:MAG TPA: hypothetical protein VHY35_19425 [Stellaceae bacterium]|jgi:hypothetical protein|nr:hypothetical protein [Stellaceae bacterium]
MRVFAGRVVATAMAAAALSGCVAVYGSPAGITVARVDPDEAAERALIGSVAGTAIGTGMGAIFAINPGIGAVVGAESGATIGAVVGAATAQPLPAYTPIAVPAAPVIPDFYDTWPPGNHIPTVGSEVPPPHPG